jgi:acetyl-CoA carboxylase carboxyl transferase subunit alpha
MRLTAQDLHELSVVDQIIPEPLGGAHRAPEEAITAVGDALEQALEPLLVLSGAELRHRRRQKFLGMGNGAAKSA